MKTYLSISQTAKATGLSIYFLRNGVKEGIIPYITSGNKALINVPALLKTLEAKASANKK